MVLPIKRVLFLSLFGFLLIFAGIGWILGADTVNLLPFRGPVGTAQITPPNGSAVAYLMDFRGQKAICFQANTATEVFIGSHTAIDNTDGWGLYNKGDNLCADLKGGTTLYFYGNGAGANVRAFIAK